MVRKRFVGWMGVAAVVLLSVACAQSDPGITTSVKSRMAADDTVKSYRIDVDTKDRVVTLSGSVDTPDAKRRAVEIARTTDGVRDVVDQLTISPGATPTTGIDDPIQREAKEAKDAADKKAGESADALGDAGITSKVKTKFLADTGVSGLKIDVDTKDGVVTLTGTVPTEAEKRRAMELARQTDGVKSVIDNLKVGR